MDPVQWKSNKAADGRVYYYNEAGGNQFPKPDALLTPAQLASGWAETTAPGGKSYWYRKDDTSKTQWEAPEGWFSDLPSRPQPAVEEPQYVASSFNYQPRNQASRDKPRDDYYRDRPSYDQGGYRGPLAATPSGVDYGSQAEAEAAFIKLLKRAGVQPDWTWEKTLISTIQDPAFRAIKEPTARKEAFEKFQKDLEKQSFEREQERTAKLRTDFRTMLTRHPEIKHYTRWRTARPMLENETVFRSTDKEEEKKKMFREYVGELRQQYMDKQRNDHEDALRDLPALIRDINLSPDSLWDETYEELQSHPAFANEEKYRTLAASEILDTYSSQIRSLWADMNTIKQRDNQLRERSARQARDGFLDLLRELQTAEKLRPDSTWKSIHPQVEGDHRYQTLLDNCRTGVEKIDGSTPEDLFFDLLEGYEREIHDARNQLETVLKDQRIKISPKTTLEEVSDVFSDRTLSDFSKGALEVAFKRLQQYISAHEDEIVRDERRQQRKAVDALRSRIKRLDPPVELEDTWEDVRPRIEKYEEYITLTPEDRRAAYDKHMSRLQEDAERDRSRRHDRRHESRHEPRRDRGEHRRTRSPPGRESREMDAYEADRRRAVEQRERQYRRASNGGLSPPPRDARRPRDYSDRDDRRIGSDNYNRERRERDQERERAYITRADPYAKAADLDYGDSSDAVTPSRPESRNGLAKRAGSEARSTRAAKRARTEKEGRLGDEAVGGKDGEDDKKEEVALQSGSEEGEIEEV